jgi:hypothetical protein
MGTIAFAVAAYLSATSGPARIQIDLALGPSTSQMSPRVIQMMVQETTRIWAPYGVDIRVDGQKPALTTRRIRLAVDSAAHPAPHVAEGSLGSIEFREGTPEPAILLYPATASALVAVTGAEQGENRWTIAYRDIVLGRTLGRALAHEVGHYILRSRGHSLTGLMQARQSIADFMAFGRNRFGLTADEVTRLRQVMRIGSPETAVNAQ